VLVPEALPKLRAEIRDRLLSNPYERGQIRLEVGGLFKLLRDFEMKLPSQQEAGWSLRLLQILFQERVLLALTPEERTSCLQDLPRMLLLREVIEHLHETKPPETAGKMPKLLHQDGAIIKRMQSLFRSYRAEKLPEDLLLSLLDLGFRYWKVAACLLGIEGRSQMVAKALKGELWSACFGSHLLHALDFGSVLEERNVLIEGPTGTGKELASRVLLASLPGSLQSGERLQYQPPPLETANLAVYPPDIVGAQLMGYKKGAYTGATRDFDGLLRRAHQGGAFLDEVGDLPLDTQVKLLRALETKQVQPLGGDKKLEASCRIISATHVDLDARIEEGSFREDLYYRLAGKVIKLPPLAARREDLEVLASSFLRGWGISALAVESVRRWCRSEEVQCYHWPGNIREFRKAVSSIVLGESWAPQRAPAAVGHTSSFSSENPASEQVAVPMKEEMPVSLDSMVRQYACQVLEAHQGNISAAARVLQVSRARLRRIVQESDNGPGQSRKRSHEEQTA